MLCIRTNGLSLLPATQALLTCCAGNSNLQTRQILACSALTVTGNGNPTQGAGMQSLLWGCVLAVLTICILCVAQKLYTVEGVINEMFKGMGTMLPMAAVLLFGFTMGMGPSGLFLGFSFGLSAAAVMMIVRIRRSIRKLYVTK